MPCHAWGWFLLLPLLLLPAGNWCHAGVSIEQVIGLSIDTTCMSLSERSHWALSSMWSLFLSPLFPALSGIQDDEPFVCETPPAVQREGLLDLYTAMNGQAWVNNTGWDDESAAPCVLRDGTFEIILPAHCCWFGVTCCRVELLDGPCDYGTVTLLHLPLNNVRF